MLEGWALATVMRQYLAFPRQKWPFEKVRMLYFGLISNLWKAAQPPTDRDAVLGRRADAGETHVALLDGSLRRSRNSSLRSSDASPVVFLSASVRVAHPPGSQAVRAWALLSRKASRGERLLRSNYSFLQNTHGSFQENMLP